MRAQTQLNRLTAALDRLALEPDEQRDYLSRLGTQGLTDEPALEFDDALQPRRHQFDLPATSHQRGSAGHLEQCA